VTAVTAPGWTLKPLPDMDERQFSQWRELLEDRTGIYVTDQRKSFLQSSLMQRMREVECDDYQKYYEQIINGPIGKIEWATLVDRLTVQETRFFRDPAAFEYVENYIEKHRSFYDKKTPLDIWSVGCSSGEEVYSLAMLADDLLSDHGVADAFTVTGTDISVPVLNRARRGCFSDRKVSLVPDYYRERYFERVSEREWQVRAPVRNKTCFAQINVLELDRVASHQRHIIYCQNLLIYFRRWRRQEILNRLVERLAPGGLLVIGMGEVVDWVHPLLEPVAKEQVAAFRKRTD